MIVDDVHDVHALVVQDTETERAFVTQKLSEYSHVDFLNCGTNHWHICHRASLGRDILTVGFFQVLKTLVTPVEHKIWAKAALPVVIAHSSMGLFQMGLIKITSYNMHVKLQHPSIN